MKGRDISKKRRVDGGVQATERHLHAVSDIHLRYEMIRRLMSAPGWNLGLGCRKPAHSAGSSRHSQPTLP